MPDTNPEIYFPETKAKAVFGGEGPQPQFLIDTPGFKSLVVGLEAGQQIPPHPAEAAMYHFLEGAGAIKVGEETFTVSPGVTVIAPAGASRGITAKTRLIFLAAKGG